MARWVASKPLNRYTTVEGLIDSIYENFKKNNPFMGDSDDALKSKIHEFYQALIDMKELKRTFTLIIDDPLDNSFLQNIYHPEPD
jgi:zinc finger protein